MAKLISFLVLLLVSKAIMGQEHVVVVTDRPSQTPATTLIPGGNYQQESGYLYRNNQQTQISSSFNHLLRFGLNEYIEVRAFIDYQWNQQSLDGADRSENGWAPLQLGAKIKVSENNGWVPAVAFVGMIALRSGENSLETERALPDLRLAFFNDLPGIFDVFYSVGMLWSGEDFTAQEIYTLGIGISLLETVWSFVEVYGTFDKNPVSPSMDVGITWRVARLIQLDLTGGFDFPAEGGYFLATGINFRL